MTLGIYIQVPFCQTKCTYCNFHTGVVSRDRYEPYAIAVSREILESAASRSDRAPVVDTVYFGGGTPSLLDPSALVKILDTLLANYSSEAPEITPGRHPLQRPCNSPGRHAGRVLRFSMCASRDSRLRSLRNFQLGRSKAPLAPQSQILAARTLLGIRRWRSLLRRQDPLGQHPR